MITILLVLCTSTQPAGNTRRTDWPDQVLRFPYPAQTQAEKPRLILLRQDHEQLQRNRSVIKTPAIIGGRRFPRGLDPEATYTLRLESGRRSATVKGKALMRGYTLSIDQPHKSELVEYRIIP